MPIDRIQEETFGRFLADQAMRKEHVQADPGLVILFFFINIILQA